jgi:hypothetical protein
VVHDEETDTTINRHEWKIACEVVVYNSAYLVANVPKHKTFAIDLLSGIRLALLQAP